MSKSQRLASFNKPSTPTKSAKNNSNPPSPSIQPPNESTYHRRLKTIISDLRLAVRTWNDLVLIDGLKATKGLVDARTELENTLIEENLPKRPVVTSKLNIMASQLSALKDVLIKLGRQFGKINTALDALESLLADAQKGKGWNWVATEPLWATWSLEKFYSALVPIIPMYFRSLSKHQAIVKRIETHSVSFQSSKEAILEWTDQSELEDVWRELEELLTVETKDSNRT